MPLFGIFRAKKWEMLVALKKGGGVVQERRWAWRHLPRARSKQLGLAWFDLNWRSSPRPAGVFLTRVQRSTPEKKYKHCQCLPAQHETIKFLKNMPLFV
jgi:hypothetical protein